MAGYIPESKEFVNIKVNRISAANMAAETGEILRTQGEALEFTSFTHINMKALGDIAIGSDSDLKLESFGKGLTLEASDGPSGISLLTGSDGVRILPAHIESVAVGQSTVTDIASNCGVITITGLTAMAGNSQSVTVTNSFVSGPVTVLLTPSNYTGTYGDDGIPLLEVTAAAGSFNIVVHNAGSTALTGDISVHWLLINH